MALPVAGFYTTGGVVITTHDFGSVEAGEFKPDSTGWKVLLYNNYGSTESDDMTSVKVSIRDTDGGTDEIWTYQHWNEIKSSSGSTGIVDDAQTVFTPVGKNKELCCGDIPSGEYRTLYARCNPPTDAAEQNVDFQLRVTFQQPATSIAKWITDPKNNGIISSTGSPFSVSTGGSTGGTIPYSGGYALIDSNEIYYGSSGSYSIATTNDGTFTLYLGESGTFSETTGALTNSQLVIAQFTSTGGNCNSVEDRRVYIASLLAGTTEAMPTEPLIPGSLYFDMTNGALLGALTCTGWTAL